MTLTPDKRLPPGPGGIGLNRLRHRLRDGVGFFEHIQREYGDVVYFRILSHRFCVVFDPEVFRTVFVTDKTSFGLGPIVTQSGMLNDPSRGMTTDGEEHARARKLVQGSFGTRALRSYGAVMIEQATKAQARWHDGDVIDLDAESLALALDISTNTFFGKDGRFEAELVHDILQAFEWSVAFNMLPMGKLIGRLPLPQNRHRANTIGALDNALHKRIANARNAGDQRTDLLSLLAHATDEDGIYEPFSDSELRDLCLVFLITGNETIATAITWCLYHLSRNPDVRERLESELQDVLGDRLPTPEDYRKLVYTRAVFDENLRLTPPAFVVGRTALADCTLGGYHVPKGTTVQLCWRVANLSNEYFPEADRFMPERWMGTQVADQTKHAYIPFGGGDHICVGSGFGKMAVVLTLATLCQRWRVDVVSPDFPEMNTTILFRLKHGLPVRLQRRETAPQSEC